MSSFARPFLGDLELTTMEELWSEGAVDAKSLHARIGPRRGISLNTVQSTLERLYRKGLLERQKVSHAYIYEPFVQREELMERLIGEVVQTLSHDRSEPMLTAFVDLAARVDEDNLDRLERLIAERRKRDRQGPDDA